LPCRAINQAMQNHHDSRPDGVAFDAVLLEVFLVWGAFELNYRSGRRLETVRLDDKTLRIDRIAPNGRSRYWTFEPGWVRVAIEPENAETNRLVLSSHGRRLQIGAFMTNDERSDLANALNDALVRWRSAPMDG